MLSVSCVIFAYNEGANVRSVLVEAMAFLAGATADWEVILVDDGSSDNTADEARAVQAEDPEHVQVVSYLPNRGIGGALKAGFAVARKEWVTLLPCDGQVPPDGLQNLFDVLAGDPSIDLVTCHFPHRFQEADNLQRKILSRGLRALMWIATGVSRKLDGVYLVRAETVRSVELRSDTFFLNLELPIKAIRAGLKPGEATMHIRPRRSGASKVVNGRRIAEVFADMVRLGIEVRWRRP